MWEGSTLYNARDQDIVKCVKNKEVLSYSAYFYSFLLNELSYSL